MRVCHGLLTMLFLAGTAWTQEPSLFITQHDFQERIAVARRNAWAKADLDSLIATADAFPSSYENRFGVKGAELPPRGGQWLHYYACPDTGSELEFHPPNHNLCPDTGKEYPGSPYDEVAFQLRHDALSRAAVNLGLAYQFTHRGKYAKQAADLLHAYADRYLSYPLHDRKNQPSIGGPRVYAQTLDESIWLIDMAWAYDLVRASGELTVDDKQHIERDLLRASCETVSKAHVEPTLNEQSWINGAIAAVGYVLHDPLLIQEALDGPIGFRHQMHSYVQQGLWVEGTWFYQFYGLRALTMTAQMASKAGTNLWTEEPALLSLLDGPIKAAFPNGNLPVSNDSKPVNLQDEDYLYEAAFAATGDSALLPVIAQSARNSRESLLYGVEHLPAIPTSPQHSALFDKAGFATLRNPDTDLMLETKFGAHGGIHGHFDKMGFILFSQGRVLGVDPGTQLYGLAIHQEWDKMTIAHNTISVDQQRQNEATGQMLFWKEGGNWTEIGMDAGAAYGTTKLQRTILLTPDYALIVDTDAATDGQPHSFDWIYHNNGIETLLNPNVPLSALSELGKDNGYQYLHDVRQASVDTDIQVTFSTDGVGSLASTDGDKNSPPGTSRATGPMTNVSLTEPHGQALLDVTVLGEPGSQIFTGNGPGPNLRVPVPFLLVRRTGKNEQFISLMATSGIKVSMHRDPSGFLVINGPNYVDHLTLTGEMAYERMPLHSSAH